MRKQDLMKIVLMIIGLLIYEGYLISTMLNQYLKANISIINGILIFLVVILGIVINNVYWIKKNENFKKKNIYN